MNKVKFQNALPTTESTLSTSERSWLLSPETVGLFVFAPYLQEK